MGKSEEITRKISELRKQSFEGWPDDSKNGYLTALKTIESLVKPDSHSPTEPDEEFKQFQKECEEEQQKVLKALEDHHDYTYKLYENQTLQKGDWMVGTFEEYKYLYELEGIIRKENCDMWAEMMGTSGIMYWIQGLDMCIKCHEENKLTAPEFIRRAENTFKTK